MDTNKPMSFLAEIEIDRKASVENLKKAMSSIDEDVTVGIKFDMKEVTDEFNKMSKKIYNVNKNNILTSTSTSLVNAMGEVLTVQERFDEAGNKYISSYKVVTEEAKKQKYILEQQKKRYEEIRQSVEKLGELEAKKLKTTKKGKDAIDEQIKAQRKLIRDQEKMLVKDGLTNTDLQGSIDNQKLKNQKLIAQTQDEIDKKRQSNYNRLLKSMALEHKYNLQSIDASEKEVELINKKKKIASTSGNSARSTLWRNGLNTESMDKYVAEMKQIYAMEIELKKEKKEQKSLYDSIIESENRILNLKKKQESSKTSDEKSVYGTQIEEEKLKLLEQRAVLQEKGLSSSQKENEIAQKRKIIEDEINVIKAKNVAKSKEEKDAMESFIKTSQKAMAIDIKNLLNSKNGEYLSNEDIKKIQLLQKRLKELNGTSLKDVKNQVSNMKLELREMTSEANTKRLKFSADNVNSLSQSIKNLTTYISGAMIIRELWQQIRNGIGYVKELDEAYTDIAISMDISREKFNSWTKDAREIAQANGLLTTSIMDMVKIYATAGESIEQIQDKLNGTAMIQNITQWDSEQTTSAVNSVINQYKLLEKEINGVTGDVANAIEYMGDALIGISNELTVDNVSGIQEMVNAIDTAGGIMEQSGASMEWYMAVTGTLKETMNATGDEIGNAFKMISARVFAQSQAMEELGESVEDIEIEARKAEKALDSVGVSIRDASNPAELRDLEDIMDDLSKKWGTLSDATKQFVAEGVAGTNRRNY